MRSSNAERLVDLEGISESEARSHRGHNVNDRVSGAEILSLKRGRVRGGKQSVEEVESLVQLSILNLVSEWADEMEIEKALAAAIGAGEGREGRLGTAEFYQRGDLV